MRNNFQIRRASKMDFDRVCSLLLTENLPITDLSAELPNFIVAEAGARLLGCIGLEVYGEQGLLRSMVVAPEHRNLGVATRLVQALLELSRSHGLKDIYLITTGAEDYFARKGFQTLSRQNVPDTIQASREFSYLCPSTAAVMKLML